MTVKNSSGTAELPHRPDAGQYKLSRSLIVLGLCWTLFLAGLCFWEYRQAYAVAEKMALADTHATYNKDLAYRRWATRHGGVYVPITADTPANPYLAHIPERDITTPSGIKLTLISPAYMIRQVHELSREQYGAQGHITSLKPLRPENAPDAWEAKALQAFETGAREISSFETIGSERYMRMMRPMTTEAGCLKCHAHQGYKVGDIRGGISVSVPWKPYHDVTRGQLYNAYLGFGGIWLIGIVGLWLAQRRIQHSVFMLEQADKKLRMNEERMYLAMRATDLGLYDLNLKTGEVLVNAGYILMLGYDPAEFHETKAKWIERLHPDDREPVAAVYRAYVNGEIPEYKVEFRQRTKDGEWKWILSIGKIMMRDADGNPERMLGTHLDITERKQAEEQNLRSLKEKEVLLKEIHHRVKNNMQVMCSLLNLQAKGIVDEAIRAMFEEARNRVMSMALIHEQLYGSTDLAHIDFKQYLQSLIASIADTYKLRDVVCSVVMEPIALDVNKGIPCGLIVNELVSNCLKYAFPEGRKGTIKVGINKDSEGNNVLTVADNGVGFPEDIDFRNTSSLGLQLVNVLTGQIHGTTELVKEEGTTFRITFPGK